jgi:hypothetical protein
MSGSASLLTIQLLSWLAARPRSYADLEDAWRSTCPLTCAWEDACNDGLVALAGERTGRASVVLTPRGREVLAASPGGTAIRIPRRSRLIPPVRGFR